MKATSSICWCGTLACLLAVQHSLGEVPDFSKYQVVIDRNLFGEPVPEPVPAAAQTPQPPVRSFAETLRLSGVIEDRDGRWVGLVDVGANPNKSSLTKVGDENSDGVKVMEADVAGGWVLLRKGEEEKRLSIEHSAPASSTASKAPLPGSTGLVRPSSPMMPHAPSLAPSLAPGGSGMSLSERLKARREALERAKAAVTSPPPPAAVASTNIVAEVSPQERMKKLREYNLELIRAKGAKGPPLPIQLTAEEDEQLVKEGVLAPQPPPAAPAQ